MGSRHSAVAILLAIGAASLAAASSLAGLAATAAEPPPAVISGADEQEIRTLETASWTAWQSHDAAFFEQFLADDHVEVHSQGITGKRSVVDGVRSPMCSVQSFSLGPFTLTAVSGETVLVTYRAEQETTCGQVRVPSPVWATSLYARRAGRWVNVLYQHTALAQR